MATKEQTAKLIDLYCFNRDRFAYMYRKKDGEPGYKTMKKPLTVYHVMNHLDGRMTLSVLGGDKNTVFSTFDIDEPGLDKVRLVVDRLVALGVPRERMYISTSGNKGHHVDIFYDKPVWKSQGEKLYEYVMADPAVAEIRVEYFPTHERCIKIPLGINYKTGRRCWYLDQETLEEVEDQNYVLGIEKWSADEFEAMMYRLNKEAKLAKIAAAKENTGAAYERRERVVMPKHAENEPVLTGTGQRHDKMLRKAVYLRCCGADEDVLREELKAWVARQNPEYIGSTEDEVAADMSEIIGSVVAKYKPSREWQRREWSSVGVVSMQDVENILKVAKTPSERKVAMLICAYTSCIGKCVMGYDTMAERTGVSLPTVVKAVKALIAAKLIKSWKRGGVKTVNGQPRFFANEYVFTDKWVYDGWPTASKKRTEFRLEDVKDDIVGFYYRTMWAMVDHDTLRTWMKPMEYKECKAGGNDHDDGTTL